MKLLPLRSTMLVAGLALAGVVLFANPASAQYRPVSGRAFPVVQNIYPAFAPTQLQQAAFRQWNYNVRVIGRTYRQVPPWLFGYNPYPQVVNYGPVYRYPTYPVYPTYPTYPTYPVYPVYSSASFSPYNVYASPYGLPSNPYSSLVTPVYP
jgi:hypothetical protein